MMSRSEELEREVEEQRARVDRSLSALQDKMSVGQLVDEAGRYVHMDDVRQGFGNFGRQVRDNPLALALVGAGVAWLMVGGGPSSRRPRRLYGREPYRGAEPYEVAELHRDLDGDHDGSDHEGSTLGSLAKKAGEAGSRAASAFSETGKQAGRAASAISDTGRYAGRRARSAYDYGRRKMHDMRDGAEEHGSAVYRGGRHYSGRMSRMFTDAMDNEPLVVGAFALAVGVAIGAVLPSTRREDELFGDMRDEVFSRAGETARQAGHRVADAARETYATARQAAADEGLTGGSETIAEKVEKVAKRTAAEAKDQMSSKTSTSTSPDVTNRP